MSGFTRAPDGRALLGGVPLDEVVARSGTPAYVYDVDGIAAATADLVRAFKNAPRVVAYAVKANTAGTIVRAVASAGGGADVVSGGELQVALGSGMPPERIVMSGVAKMDWEIDLAISTSIRALQVESVEEIGRIAARARSLGRTAKVSMRINPSVVIDSHAHIATGHDEAKFGVTRSDLPAALAAMAVANSGPQPTLELVGVSTHVGSMLASPGPYLESARVVVSVARELRARGMALDFVDFGGGFGIDYGDTPTEPPSAFAEAALELLEREGLGDLTLIVEPGRALVAPFGVLVAKVIQTKQSGTRRWMMIDAGMNDLVRPALYGARHRIESIDAAPSGAEWQVVGPVCESSDDFGRHPIAESTPALVVIRDAGAYGYTMSSEYNGRALPAEVFLSGAKVAKIAPTLGSEAWVAARLRA